MTRLALMIALALTATTTLARAEGDEHHFTGEGIRLVLTDKTYVGSDDSGPTEQSFSRDGQTVYLAGGKQSIGKWEVRGNKYCSLWPPSGEWSCYDLLDAGRELIFVSSSGKRYPVVEKK